MKKISLEIEKKLLPRLRYMGFALIFFSLFSLTYAIIADPSLPTLELTPSERAAKEEELMGLSDFDPESDFIVTYSELLNLYLVAMAFGVVGSLCLFAYWKKKKEFASESETSPTTPEENGA